MKRRQFILGSLTCCVVGCEPFIESEGPVTPLKLPKREYVLALALDASGSFIEEVLGSEGRAYNFMMQAANRLFQDRMGQHDRILIAQLSANARPLLWEGPPRSLKREFGSGKVLQEFILQRADPNGSRLYAGTEKTLNYIYRLPGVSENEISVCVLVLSDMLDNSDTSADDRKRMIAALSQFKDLKAAFGYYFVDIERLEDTRQCLMDAGLDGRFVEPGIVDDPPLPSFVE